MKRRSIWTTILVVVAMVAVAGIAEAKGKKSADAVRGKVISVSATSMVIQVGHKKKADPTAATGVAAAPTQVTVTFAAGCTVTLNDQPSTLAQLAAGDRVQVFPSTSAATSIIAKSGHAKKHKNNA